MEGQADRDPVPPWNSAVHRVVYDKFPHKQATVIGWTLIALGVLCIIFNIVDLSFLNSILTAGIAGHGLWTGLASIIAGAFGINSAGKKTRCAITVFNVLCMLTAGLATFEFAAAITGAVIFGAFSSESYSKCYDSVSTDDCHNILRSSTAMEALLVILSVGELTVALWGCAICYRVIPCCGFMNFTQQPGAQTSAATSSNAYAVTVISNQHTVPMQYYPNRQIPDFEYTYRPNQSSSTVSTSSSPQQHGVESKTSVDSGHSGYDQA